MSDAQQTIPQERMERFERAAREMRRELPGVRLSESTEVILDFADRIAELREKYDACHRHVGYCEQRIAALEAELAAARAGTYRPVEYDELAPDGAEHPFVFAVGPHEIYWYDEDANEHKLELPSRFTICQFTPAPADDEPITQETLRAAGWAFVIGSRKAHYFVAGFSLCGRFGLSVKAELDSSDNSGPDDCKACRDKLARRKQKEAQE